MVQTDQRDAIGNQLASVVPAFMESYSGDDLDPDSDFLGKLGIAPPPQDSPLQIAMDTFQTTPNVNTQTELLVQVGMALLDDGEVIDSDAGPRQLEVQEQILREEVSGVVGTQEARGMVTS